VLHFTAAALPADCISVAAELLGHRVVEQITVVVPTEHLKVQWAQAAGHPGLAQLRAVVIERI